MRPPPPPPPRSSAPTLDGPQPRRVVGVAGNASLRVVLRLDARDPLNSSKPSHAGNPLRLYDRLKLAFDEADLPICLAHHLPAIRIEDVGEGQRVFVEVLVLDGAPLEEKLAHLRSLLRLQHFHLPLG